jgi:hypothetical protein
MLLACCLPLVTCGNVWAEGQQVPNYYALKGKVVLLA